MANPQAENGHTDIANEIVEALAKTQLCGYESRLLWAIWRKTYGWHKKTDWINFKQFKELTKIGNDSHISRTLKRLVKRNILTKNGKYYGFKKDYDHWIKLPKLVSEVTKIGKKKLPKLVATTGSTKETLQKKLLQKKDTTIVVSVAKPQNKRNPQLTELVEYADQLNFVLQGTLQQNRFSAFNCLQKFKLDGAKKLVFAAVQCRGKPYSPTINDFTALYRKAGDLVIYYKKGKNDKQFINLDR